MSVILNKLSKEAGDRLFGGELGIIPTDTVYGAACCAVDQASVQRLYALKVDSEPGTVIAANTEQLVKLGLKARYLKPVEQYWPNALSIVIPNYELDYIHRGKGSIAVRVPDDKSLQALLAQTGPLLTINAEGLHDKVDFVVDVGDLSDRQPSTLIRIVDDAIEILRPGAVNINEAGEIQ